MSDGCRMGIGWVSAYAGGCWRTRWGGGDVEERVGAEGRGKVEGRGRVTGLQNEFGRGLAQPAAMTEYVKGSMVTTFIPKGIAMMSWPCSEFCIRGLGSGSGLGLERFLSDDPGISVRVRARVRVRVRVRVRMLCFIGEDEADRSAEKGSVDRTTQATERHCRDGFYEV